MTKQIKSEAYHDKSKLCNLPALTIESRAQHYTFSMNIIEIDSAYVIALWKEQKALNLHNALVLIKSRIG